MQKRIILTSVLAATLVITVVGCGNVEKVGKVEAPVTETATTIGKLSLTEGELAGEYEGQIVGGKANGKGKITFKNGDDWVGMFKDNKWIGNGIITYRREGQPNNVKDFDVDTIQPYVEPVPVKAPEGTIRTPGIVVYNIVFHEGFRAAGLKAVDVHIITRSTNFDLNRDATKSSK